MYFLNLFDSFKAQMELSLARSIFHGVDYVIILGQSLSFSQSFFDSFKAQMELSLARSRSHGVD